jgi:hypothetical protein
VNETTIWVLPKHATTAAVTATTITTITTTGHLEDLEDYQRGALLVSALASAIANATRLLEEER